MTEFRSRRHIAESTILEKYGAIPVHDENLSIIGISIGIWSITSSSSRIGTELEMDQMESAVQSKVIGNRRVSLPEIVFTNAFVKLKIKSLAEFRFKAQDALEEWAECHTHLDDEASDTNPNKGVSVIKSIDAKLWEERFSDTIDNTRNDENLFQFDQDKCSTEFNYDWTFSSPFSGKVESYCNVQSDWIEIPESGIDMEMLKDTSQPILYFDDVNLYEDDMHDNGFVSLRCKLRIMPKCFYVLLTFFLRVDHVLIRVKEVRLFSKLPEKDGDTVRVYKDIVWRECLWKHLKKQNLPVNIKEWRIEEEDISGVSAQQRIQVLVQSLPVCSLPQSIFTHSYIEIGT